MTDRPWFLWDLEIGDAQFRERLRHPDPDIRAQWIGRLMREAQWAEVWQYVTVDEVLANWNLVQRHLGRERAFWEWLIQGWRKDGLVPAA